MAYCQLNGEISANSTNNPNVKLQITSALNLEILLSDPHDLELDCLDIVDLVFSSRPDLTDQPLENLDGNSRMEAALWNRAAEG